MLALREKGVLITLNYRLFVPLFAVTLFLCQTHANELTQLKKANSEKPLPEVAIKKAEKKQSQQQLDDGHWMHTFHQSVSDSVYQSAVWFDNFFVDDNNEYEKPTTSARIRLGWKPKARDWNGVEARFRIKVKLPHFKNKVDLILSDDDETNQSQLPLESINTRSELEDEHFAAAVRYTHNKNSNRLLESRVGFSGGDLFFKVRHKRRFNWDDKHSVRVEPALYYFIGDGLGSKLLLEYDYQLDPKTQFRVNYSIRGSEAFSGIRWKHGFYRLKQLGAKTASITGLQVEGVRNGTDDFQVDNYTLSYRYRFNAVREWLYFEVEPFIEWPEEKNYSTTPGITFRIEGYFNKG